MQCAFLPIFLLVVCATGLAVGLLAAAGLCNPGRPGRVTQMPYESGMDPIHDTRRRFDVRFHLLAIAFLVFDVELLFLYPWAVSVGGQNQASLCERADERGQPETAAPDFSPVRNHASLSTNANPRSVAPSNHRLVFSGVMAFLALLTFGFIYDWRKGVFRWR